MADFSNLMYRQQPMGNGPQPWAAGGMANPLLRRQYAQRNYSPMARGQYSPMGGAPEEPAYDNQGMFGVGPDEFAENKEALRKNPYGNLTGKEQREPIDDLRRAGFRTDDPSGWAWLQNKFAGYRGPHNPKGEQSPWNMNKYYDHSQLGIMTPHVTDLMTQPEKYAYSTKRFNYDTGLRGGLSDESTYERKRRLEEENPGKKVVIGTKGAGNYDKFGNPVKRWHEGL